MSELAVILGATITALGGVIVVLLQGNRGALRNVEKKVQTRNGDSLGEVIEDIYAHSRSVDNQMTALGSRVKGLEDIQDDLVEGVGWIAVEMGKLQHRGKDEQ